MMVIIKENTRVAARRAHLPTGFCSLKDIRRRKKEARREELDSAFRELG